VSRALATLSEACSTAPLADLAVVPKWCLVADFLAAVDVADSPSLDHTVDLLALLDALVADYADHCGDGDAAAAKHLALALDAVLRAAELFGGYVAATLDGAVVGVDLARDDRRRRCDIAKKHFLAIGAHLATLRKLVLDKGDDQRRHAHHRAFSFLLR